MVNTTIVTGTNIIDRHRKLVPSIGTLSQEDDSYFLVTRLMIGLPIAVTLASILDCFICIKKDFTLGLESLRKTKKYLSSLRLRMRR